MNSICWGVLLALGGLVDPVPNPIYRDLIDHGVEVNGVSVPLPRPSLSDGQDAAASRVVLGAIAGDDRSVANLIRDSVSAPFVLKTRDIPAGDAIIRAGDLWFVVRGNLDGLDLKQVLGKTAPTTVEAGNMRLTTKLLGEPDLANRPLTRLPEQPGRDEWFTHATGRLLDRIAIEVTDHSIATRTADSITIASTTSRAFDGDPTWPNHWTTITKSGANETTGPPQNYVGGSSYLKVTRLTCEPGALFVEAHFAFVEPQPWFAGNPILRSKFSLICQDQIRQFRRKIQQLPGAK